jgi:hypothetical protein
MPEEEKQEQTRPLILYSFAELCACLFFTDKQNETKCGILEICFDMALDKCSWEFASKERAGVGPTRISATTPWEMEELGVSLHSKCGSISSTIDFQSDIFVVPACSGF